MSEGKFCDTCRFWDAGIWVKDLECRCFCEANRQADSVFVTAPFYSCGHWQKLEELDG